MNIKCSGDKYGVIDSKTCLECAVTSKTPPCGYSYPLLKAMLAGSEDRTGEIHVTDITSCLRKSYFSKVNPEPPYIHDLLVLFIGNAVHKYIEDTNESSEIPVSNGDIVGKVDYFDGETLIDWKTTRWLSKDNLPYGSHEGQVNYYRKLLEGDGGNVKDMFIQYIDMSGPTKCSKCKNTLRIIDGVTTCPTCFRQYPNGHLGAVQMKVPHIDIDADLSERSHTLKTAIETNCPPAPEDSWLCRYCSVQDCEFATVKEAV